MLKKETKSLKQKLFDAMNKVLKNNKTIITNKIGKVLQKAIKQIVKKSDKQVNKIPNYNK